MESTQWRNVIRFIAFQFLRIPEICTREISIFISRSVNVSPKNRHLGFELHGIGINLQYCLLAYRTDRRSPFKIINLLRLIWDGPTERYVRFPVGKESWVWPRDGTVTSRHGCLVWRHGGLDWIVSSTPRSDSTFSSQRSRLSSVRVIPSQHQGTCALARGVVATGHRR